MRNQSYKKGRKMNKESIDPGHLYVVRELAEIYGVNYRIGLNWVQLGEIDSVKIGGTHLITGERIQDRLNQKFMLYWLLYLVFVRRRNLEILGDPARLPRSYTYPTFPSLANKYSHGVYYLFSLSTSFCLRSLMWFKNLLQSRSIISSMREVMFCISEIRHSI